MKMKLVFLVGALLAGVPGFGAHKFICADDGLRRAAVFNESGECVWEHKMGKPYAAKLLAGGSVLMATGRSVEAVSAVGGRLWSYSPGGEIYGVDVCRDGRIVVGECSNRRVTVLSAKGEALYSFRVRSEVAKAHVAMRAVRVTDSDTVLLGMLGDKRVLEYSLDGELLNEFPVDGLAYMGCRLENGNTLIGHETGVTEFSPDKQIVWQLRDEDVPSVRFNFITCVARLQNGNTVVGNWLGHGFRGRTASVFEVAPDKEVVWRHDRLRSIRQPTDFEIVASGQYREFLTAE